MALAMEPADHATAPEAAADVTGNGVEDLMGDDSAVGDRDVLLGSATESDAAPLGVDALSGNLMSPKPQSPEVENAGPETTGMAPDDDAVKAQAALKIQTRQRGVQERKKVEAERAAGNLPGQRRAVLAKPVYRESEKSEGEIEFYDGIGSKYSGELLNGRPHGKGTYYFANGNIYKGDFVDGQFEGAGEMIFPGYGKYVSTFENGRSLGGNFVFEDKLAYQPQSWPYCVEGDRRFYHEVVDPRFGLVD